jgi:hypothetical protein
MKTLGRQSLLLLAIGLMINSLVFVSGAPASEIKPRDLPRIKAELISTCGDIWCNGGDYNFNFLSVKKQGRSLKITARVSRASGAPIKDFRPVIRSCLVYGHTEIEQVFDRDCRPGNSHES